MSANLQLFPSGAAEGWTGWDALSGPPAEMNTLRSFVNDRLTAAGEEILRVFGETLAQYREQIDRQRRQLDSLKPGGSERLRAAGPSFSPRSAH
ncbi:hypothetical protein LDENG_00222160 [Lucifuga dentata]|nr:hypothetical protein LDENG_00222160 [Lucifuga dentata]